MTMKKTNENDDCQHEHLGHSDVLINHIGATDQDKVRHAYRARVAIAKKAMEIQANGYETFNYVRNPRTGEAWVQCSEGLWDEYKVFQF